MKWLGNSHNVLFFQLVYCRFKFLMCTFLRFAAKYVSFVLNFATTVYSPIFFKNLSIQESKTMPNCVLLLELNAFWRKSTTPRFKQMETAVSWISVIWIVEHWGSTPFCCVCSLVSLYSERGPKILLCWTYWTMNIPGRCYLTVSRSLIQMCFRPTMWPNERYDSNSTRRNAV